jgi:conjugal transfer/entry exclusion protein
VNVPLLTDSLVEFYDIVEIRSQWRQILDACLGRVQLPMQINSRSRDGSTAGSIVVSTLAEAEGYIQACKAAVQRLDPTATTAVHPDHLGTGVDFSQRPVLV